jgi:hypothetical protein
VAVSADDGAGGHDALAIDGRAEQRIAGARRTSVGGAEHAKLRQGRSRDVTGAATLAVTGALTATADQALRARQAGSVVALVDRHATVAPERTMLASTAGGEMALDPAGSATLKLARLTLRCGSAEVTIGDGRVTVKAPTVVAHGAMGKVQVDAQGATTAGQEVKASAVLLNEVKGAMVIISDSPGNLAALAADKHHVPDGKGTVK